MTYIRLFALLIFIMAAGYIKRNTHVHCVYVSCPFKKNIKNFLQVGLFFLPVMVHMECSSVRETAQEDLQPAARALFSIEDDRGMERRVGTVE